MTGPDAILRPAAGRRALAVGVVGLLGILLGAVAVQPGITLPARPILALGGVAALWAAWRVWCATASVITLSDAGLFDGQGRQIARLDDIASVDRGTFAFKPAGGFLIRLHHPAPPAWVPGMWWRRGRRIGIGGVTHPAMARAMADQIALRIAHQGSTS